MIDADIAPPIHRFSHFVGLGDEACDALHALAGPTFAIARHAVLRDEGEPADGAFLLFDGWVASGTTRGDGGRLITKFHLPGDVMGMPSIACTRAAETLTALTPVTAARLSSTAITRLFATMPRLAALFFVLAQQERVILADRMASMGRSPAESSMAAMLIQLYDRLLLLDAEQSATIAFPITQEEIGDALGLTPVHVNRVLRSLVAQRLIERQPRRIMLCDIARLRMLAGVADRVPAALDWLPAEKSMAMAEAVD